MDILGADRFEVAADLGAYNGDTARELIEFAPHIRKIIALEPDRRSYKKLLAYAENLNDITTVQKAVSNKDSVAFFNAAAGRQSSFSDKGDEIETVTVDTLVSDKKLTYLKMDVEGAEIEALCGAEKTLKNQKPKLNIALYHRSEDIFLIPLQIAQMNPDYRFYLRRHPYIPCWDMNLYCI
jgi:FkbM family methyltransferase